MRHWRLVRPPFTAKELDQVPVLEVFLSNNFFKFKLPNINYNKIKNTKRSSKQNGN